MPTGSKLIFRFEPFILAAECRDMNGAQQLVAVARQAGFRESGVTATKARTIAGIRCSLRLEVLHPLPTPVPLLVPLLHLDIYGNTHACMYACTAGRGCLCLTWQVLYIWYVASKTAVA